MSKSAVVFPGQGAQAVGMGLDVFEASPAARGVFARAGAILGWDVAGACFGGPPEALERTDVQQPAIFTTSAAIMAAFEERGGRINSQAFAGGLSLGEYTALYAAGTFDFETALRLVQQRGSAMQDAAKLTPGGMITLVGAEEADATRLCDDSRGADVLAPANLNCPGQVVVSGHCDAIERLRARAEAGGFRCVLLPVAGAFHSPLMRPAADRLTQSLSQARVERPKCPVVRNTDGEYHSDPTDIRRDLAGQLTSPVLWQACVERMIRDGAGVFVEFGPGRVLTGLLRKISRAVKGVNLSTAEALTSVGAAGMEGATR